MATQYKIISQPDSTLQSVTLLLDGKFSEESLPELTRSIAQVRDTDRIVILDLSEVTLVDRKAVQYFSEQASLNVKLVNCPIYLKSWIAQISENHES